MSFVSSSHGWEGCSEGGRCILQSLQLGAIQSMLREIKVSASCRSSRTLGYASSNRKSDVFSHHQSQQRKQCAWLAREILLICGRGVSLSMRLRGYCGSYQCCRMIWSFTPFFILTFTLFKIQTNIYSIILHCS